MREWYNKNWYRTGAELLREIEASAPAAGELYIWYIGQCGFVMKSAGITLVIDAVLNDLANDAGISRRHYSWPFAPEELTVDYAFCTHAHADHMAIPTVAGLAANPANQKTVFVVPGDCIPAMREAGIGKKHIVEAHAGEKMAFDGLTVTPIMAAHPLHVKTAEGGDVALSYLLDFDGLRVLHMGDTYLTDQLLADLQKLPAPDLFLPPINGGDYFRTARNCIGNLNAREAATLSVMLQADVTIPTHYDMVMDNIVDPLDFVRELRALDSSRKFQLPALGERIILKKEMA